jgi:hypothetical protein
MHDSQTYRRNAVDCLVAAHDAGEFHYKRLYLLMAQSWHSLASLEDEVDGLLSSWDIAEPVESGGIVLTFRHQNTAPPAEAQGPKASCARRLCGPNGSVL